MNGGIKEAGASVPGSTIDRGLDPGLEDQADDAKILEAGGVVEKEDDDTSPINVVGQGQPSQIYYTP